MIKFPPLQEYWMPERDSDHDVFEKIFGFWFHENLDLFQDTNAKGILKAVREMNIQSVLYDLIRERNISVNFECGWFGDLRTEALQIAGTCAYRQSVIESLALQMESAGIVPIWLKGPALGNSVYPRPHWRTYKDLDLLISSDNWDTTVNLMLQSGYHSKACLNWGYLSFEKAFQPDNDIPGSLDVELHLKLSNRSRLNVFTYQELIEDAVHISNANFPFLIPASAKHFIYLCLHRVGHHSIDRRFAWLMDLHFLIEKFTHEDWQKLLQFSIQNRVSKIVLSNLKEIKGVFPSAIPNFVFDKMTKISEEKFEPSEIYLSPKRNKWTDLWTRWQEMPGWLLKFKYLLHWMIPPKSYLNEAVGHNPILVQHKDRIVNGVKKYFSR